MRIKYTEIDRTRLVLFLILIIYLLFACLTLNNRSSIGDEFGTIWLASQSNSVDIINIVHKYDVHPPTHYLLLHYWGKIFGYSDFYMRLNSIVLLLVSLFVIWKLILVIFPDIDQKSKFNIYVLCVSTPGLWVIGYYARYYALGLLLSLLSIYFFLLWYSKGQKKQLILYILFTTFIFYLHYFLAFIIVIVEGTYFIYNYFIQKNTRIKTWLISQVIIVIAFLPIFIWSVYPILSGQNDTLSGSAFEGLSGVKAIPVSTMGQSLTLFNGAAIFPWTLWITIPQVFILLYIIYLFYKKNGTIYRFDILFFFIVPFAILVTVIPILLPYGGYFIGIFRAPFIIVTFWMFAGYIITSAIKSQLKKLVILIILICNIYSVFIFGFNNYSMAQSPPLKEMSYIIKEKTPEQNKVMVIDPWSHGWIKGHAISRYLPANFMVQEIKDNSGGGITIDSCESIIQNLNLKYIWVIQANRFAAKNSLINQKIINLGFQEVFTEDFTKQSDFDLWFKREIKNLPFLKFTNASPMDYIYTINYYYRD
jgi:hypothetical protein